MVDCRGLSEKFRKVNSIAGVWGGGDIAARAGRIVKAILPARVIFCQGERLILSLLRSCI